MKTRTRKTRKPEASNANVANRNPGRPRAEEQLGQFALEGLLWLSFKDWLTTKRESPRGLPTRTALWNVVPNKRRYFECLALLAFTKFMHPESHPELSHPELLIEAYTTDPVLTCDALLFLIPRAAKRKTKDLWKTLINVRPPGDKYPPKESIFKFKHRRAVEDYKAAIGYYNAATGV